MKNVAGVLLALTGVFWYTHLKLDRAREEKEARERSETLKAPMMAEEKEDVKS